MHSFLQALPVHSVCPFVQPRVGGENRMKNLWSSFWSLELARALGRPLPLTESGTRVKLAPGQGTSSSPLLMAMADHRSKRQTREGIKGPLPCQPGPRSPGVVFSSENVSLLPAAAGSPPGPTIRPPPRASADTSAWQQSLARPPPCLGGQDAVGCPLGSCMENPPHLSLTEVLCLWAWGFGPQRPALQILAQLPPGEESNHKGLVIVV